jgi:hypothetical protein
MLNGEFPLPGFTLSQLPPEVVEAVAPTNRLTPEVVPVRI